MRVSALPPWPVRAAGVPGSEAGDDDASVDAAGWPGVAADEAAGTVGRGLPARSACRDSRNLPKSRDCTAASVAGTAAGAGAGDAAGAGADCGDEPPSVGESTRTPHATPARSYAHVRGSERPRRRRHRRLPPLASLSVPRACRVRGWPAVSLEA